MIEIKDLVRENVRKIRNAKGLTQVQLAQRAGMAVRYLNRLENSPQNVSIDQLARLAEALDVTVADLVSSSNATDALPARALEAINSAMRSLETLRYMVTSDDGKGV